MLNECYVNYKVQPSILCVVYFQSLVFFCMIKDTVEYYQNLTFLTIKLLSFNFPCLDVVVCTVFYFFFFLQKEDDINWLTKTNKPTTTTKKPPVNSLILSLKLVLLSLSSKDKLSMDILSETVSDTDGRPSSALASVCPWVSWRNTCKYI